VYAGDLLKGVRISLRLFMAASVGHISFG